MHVLSTAVPAAASAYVVLFSGGWSSGALTANVLPLPDRLIAAP
jgi:hypothetical protein